MTKEKLIEMINTIINENGINIENSMMPTIATFTE